MDNQFLYITIKSKLVLFFAQQLNYSSKKNTVLNSEKSFTGLSYFLVCGAKLFRQMVTQKNF